jgi:hypothetical protein
VRQGIELINKSAVAAGSEETVPIAYNAGGCIRVELLPSQSFAECRVTDDGTNEGNICPGHGLTIVEALVRSLGGTLDQHFGPQGATSVLIFPYRPLKHLFSQELRRRRK